MIDPMPDLHDVANWRHADKGKSNTDRGIENMPIAEKLKSFLEVNNATYEVTQHPHTSSSMETAEEAHVPGDRLAKAVIVKTHDHYAMVVVPADYYVDLDKVGYQIHDIVGMATEDEIAKIFTDCARGAIPPVGEPYGLPSYLDSALRRVPEVYFEAGDHELLVKVSDAEFSKLQASATEATISHHM